MRAIIIVGIIFSAILAGAFALAANLISGAQLIGVSTMSGIIIGALFGIAGAFCVGISSAVSGKSSALFYLAGGFIYGMVMYVANVYAGMNAGFSLFGLVLIGCFGLMSGIGCLAAERLLAPFGKLQQLS
jgi:hypothetical protein